MITKALIDRVLKLVQIRKDENSKKQVARIYDPRATVPEAIYNELEPGSNIFHDTMTGTKYHLTPTGLITI